MNKYRFGVVAVIPFWSQSDNLNADSNYAYLRLVLPEMVNQTEDTVFLMMFPDPKYGADQWVYKPDGLQSERIRFYPWNYDTQMQTSVVGFDPVRFHRLEDDQAPVVYWLNQVESGPFIVGGYGRVWAAVAQPTLIAQHHYIIHRSLPYQYEALFPRQWLQMGGSLASDVVIYNSKHCRAMANDAFGEYLTAAKMNELERKSVTLPFGLLRGDEPLAPEARAERPVFIYNHRFEAYKRPEITFAAFESLRQAGYLFEVWATQTIGQKTKAYHIDRSMYAPSRLDYLNNIAVPAINTINSTHETFCISILDSLALGHLVVLPNAITFPELVPEGYPFLFRNPAEQLDMLKHILATFPQEYNRWRVPLSEHARAKFDLKQYVARYLAVIDQAEQARRVVNRRDTTVAALAKVFAAFEFGKRYRPNDVRNALQRSSNLGKQAFPTRRVVREALALRDDIHILWDGGVRMFKD